jgi:hypothetical protein
MAFIGNQVTTVPFITDTFSGNGSATAFTLTRAPAGTAAIAVFVGGSYTAPINYSVSGVTLNFVSAPTAGTNNIVVLHLGTGSATQVPSDGSVTNAKMDATGVSAATYGSSSSIPVLVVNAQGRVTGASNVSVTSTAVFANSGQLSANASSGNVQIGLANTTVTVGTYGGATNVASIVVDQFGRITSASNVAVSGIDAHPFLFTAMGS